MTRACQWYERGARGVLVAAGVALLVGCGGDERRDEAAESEAPQGEVIEHKSDLGPVHATVTVAPAKPTLGDPITLTLKVEAEQGVTVEMPSFGEALGRFQIVQYVPRESMEGGKWVATQTYTLQAPMSGKQRIPPLRIDFTDERPGQAGPRDAGVADGGPGRSQELLTEEIALDVTSVVPDGAVSAELSSARGSLGTTAGRPWYIWALHAGIGVWLLITAALLVWAWRAKARRATRISAYGAAMARLARLESRGLPTGDEADAWYVELSSIVRRYLEERYNLRAPELTTEEFLQVAQRYGMLMQKHRELLHVFLMSCDRVKFARYAPNEDESSRALESARSFLEETRMREDTSVPAPAAAPASTSDSAAPAPANDGDGAASQAGAATPMSDDSAASTPDSDSSGAESQDDTAPRDSAKEGEA